MTSARDSVSSQFSNESADEKAPNTGQSAPPSIPSHNLRRAPSSMLNGKKSYLMQNICATVTAPLTGSFSDSDFFSDPLSDSYLKLLKKILQDAACDLFPFPSHLSGKTLPHSQMAYKMGNEEDLNSKMLDKLQEAVTILIDDNFIQKFLQGMQLDCQQSIKLNDWNQSLLHYIHDRLELNYLHELLVQAGIRSGGIYWRIIQNYLQLFIRLFKEAFEFKPENTWIMHWEQFRYLYRCRTNPPKDIKVYGSASPKDPVTKTPIKNISSSSFNISPSSLKNSKKAHSSTLSSSDISLLGSSLSTSSSLNTSLQPSTNSDSSRSNCIASLRASSSSTASYQIQALCHNRVLVSAHSASTSIHLPKPVQQNGGNSSSTGSYQTQALRRNRALVSVHSASTSIHLLKPVQQNGGSSGSDSLPSLAKLRATMFGCGNQNIAPLAFVPARIPPATPKPLLLKPVIK